MAPQRLQLLDVTGSASAGDGSSTGRAAPRTSSVSLFDTSSSSNAAPSSSSTAPSAQDTDAFDRVAEQFGRLNDLFVDADDSPDDVDGDGGTSAGDTLTSPSTEDIGLGMHATPTPTLHRGVGRSDSTLSDPRRHFGPEVQVGSKHSLAVS